MELFKLFGTVFIDNNKANQSLDETDNKGKLLATNIGKIGESATKMALAVGTAAIAAGGAMFAVASKTADYASQINDASKVTSLTTDNLQQLKYAAEQSGVSFESLTGAATKFNKNMAEAAQGSKSASGAFAQLGISLTGEGGKIKSSNDLFDETIKKLAKMGDTAQATAIGTDLFGKGFANLKPLLAEGAAGIDALKARAVELGLVMNNEAIQAGDKFGDTVDELKQQFGMFGKELGIVVMPYMQKFAEWIQDHMPEIKKVAKEVFEGLGNAMEFVGKHSNILIPILVTLLAAITGFNILKGILTLMDLWKASTIAMALANGALTISFGPAILIFAAVAGAIALIAMNIEWVIKMLAKLGGAIGTGLGWLFSSSAPPTMSTGRIPGLAEGGKVERGGSVLVGERAPEILNLPRGATVTPLEKLGSGDTVTNYNGDIHVSINPSDLKEFSDVTEFFSMAKKMRPAYGR